ncbi:GNAT family N-acetyltransferase [Massilia sp. LXY-6]|uniref:GNAT family N-acetyltransferase n=1 Tax=Massilia sp. LXY-6 TaxID=3379823 RepID=UPI003EDEC66B
MPKDLMAAAGPATADEVSVSYYETILPSLEPELDLLYQNFNSSLSHFAIRQRARQAGAYVVRRNGCPVAIFLLRQEGQTMKVVNEMIELAPEEIERLKDYVFDRFPSVSRISFSLIGKDIGGLRFIHQQYGHSEDIVVTLPKTVDAYLSSLSSKMRHNIRHQLKAIAADHPGFHFATYENEEIDVKLVHDLISLKKANMHEKRIPFGLQPEEMAWMTERAKTSGLLVVALFDGQVCGGSLSLRIGDHYFAQMVGYDARFTKYSLGMLCCYLAMQEKIKRGAKEAHLSWGRNEYKFKLLGIQRDMANLDIYRSRAAYLLNINRVAKNAALTRLQELKIYLLENEHREGRLPWVARKIVGGMRKVKRLTYRQMT